MIYRSWPKRKKGQKVGEVDQCTAHQNILLRKRRKGFLEHASFQQWTWNYE